MQLAGRHTLVVGLGRTGTAVAKFLHRRGARVTVTDLRGEKQLGAGAEEIRALGVAMELGGHRSETFRRAELVVLSPGVDHTVAVVREAAAAGAEVLGEIELASRFITAPLVAVTGTNGKTTTTELIAAMLRSAGKNVFVGGNIGKPLIGYVESGSRADVVVAEISSFQLDTTVRFHPQVAVLLNIAPDHLDRYPGFEAYAASKMRLFANQTPADVAVLNGDDPNVPRRAGNVAARKLFFPAPAERQEGARLNGRYIRFQLGTESPPPVDLAGWKLPGRHNRENACAAVLAALAAGADIAAVQAAVRRFRGLAHRLEYVASINGVRFFNDSKATNVAAAVRALECFSEPVILLMGGRDKGGEFQQLEGPLRRHVKCLVLLGEAAGRIRNRLGHLVPTMQADTMDAAVAGALASARPGDVVLLSPACASFDMYADYARRGDDFRRAVEALKA